MGSGLVRYKAEVDFDGRELTRSYLDKQDLEMMLEEVRSMKSINEMEAFLLKHGENIGSLFFFKKKHRFRSNFFFYTFTHFS